MATVIDEFEILNLLSSLSDKSLVLSEQTAQGTRYRLLETVREYATESLLEAGEQSERRNRHVDHFLDFAEFAEPKLRSADQKEWFERIDVEYENIRAALAWSLEGGGACTKGIQLANAMWLYWPTRGHAAEGSRWYEAVFQFDNDGYDAADLGRAFTRAGNLILDTSDFDRALDMYSKALAIRRTLGDQTGIASILHNIGNIHRDFGDFAKARAGVEESLALRREIGDEPGICDSLFSLADIFEAEGNSEAALDFFQQALTGYEKLGHKRAVARILNCLGNVAAAKGDLIGATSHYQTALDMASELGDRIGTAVYYCNLGLVYAYRGEAKTALVNYLEGVPITLELRDRKNIAFALEGLALVAVLVNKRLDACRIWGAAEKLREDINSPIKPIDRGPYDVKVAEVRAALSDSTGFAEAWTAGRKMTMEDAIDFALNAGQAN